jgi:hypothetical protein
MPNPNRPYRIKTRTTENGRSVERPYKTITLHGLTHHLFPYAALLLCVFVLSFSAHAQTDDYPTVAALREARLPARDRVDLARRFLGVTDLPAPPQNPPAREVGEEDQFWITVEDGTEQITAVLRAVGDHSYVWVDQRVPIAEADAARVTEAFDTQIYEQARALWGDETNPGIDGDPRIYLLFAAQLRPGTGGYFTSDHLYPSQIATATNMR